VSSVSRRDRMLNKMTSIKDKYSINDYLDPKNLSIPNALTVEFNDGTALPEVVVEYPIGHKRRRKEGIPHLVEKFQRNLARRFPPQQQKTILELCKDQKRLEQTPVNEFVDLMVV